MPTKLIEYNQKRNFEKTLEPEGDAAEFRGNQESQYQEYQEYQEYQVVQSEVQQGDDFQESLKFVIQHHLARRDHYDLRLEWRGTLLSWAVPKGPSHDTHDKRLAIQVEDHPLEYRNFEGTIPKGEYGGGVVMLWDEGTWEPYGNVDEGLREGNLKFVLKGIRLKGKWALVRLKRKEGEKKEHWLFLKEKDEYAGVGGNISEFVTSIRTGRTMEQIEKGEGEKFTRNPMDQVDLQFPKLVSAVPEGDQWLFELKYDGYRILAFVEGNGVRLITRNGNDYTNQFGDVASSLIRLANGRAMILDGEMVITDDTGKSNFQALQNYMGNPKGKNPTYIVFDLLALDGTDLREQSLTQRKIALEALLKDASPNLYFSKHIRGNGKENLNAACKLNLEGIVGKRVDSIYNGGKNGDWIKVKCHKRQEFVIGGFSVSEKKARGISSLLLGYYVGEEFIYAGRTGTGFSQSIIDQLQLKFKDLKRETPPFTITPKVKSNEEITWIEPELVAEVQFSEWTEDNLLRQASFKGLRIDKNPRDIIREDLGHDSHQDLEINKKPINPHLQNGESEKPMEKNTDNTIIDGVKLSNPDKIIFDDPQITKSDVARYYEQVAERMLPYVSHRILSIVRCPKGASQPCFYKKHPGPGSKGIVTIDVPSSKGDSKEYFYIENASGLIWEVQMGTLEFHTWGSRVEELEKPDIMVFDLDPDEGMDVETICSGVKNLKSVLDELSLKSYLKTSGGKGYHVVVPLKPSVSWDTFNDFAKGVAQVMEKKWPDRYTSNVRKANRANKIFIDWIRNGRGATSIAPYSLRAREGARISMPIFWDELDRVPPDSIDIENALLRITGEDPWEDFFRNHQMLK